MDDLITTTLGALREELAGLLTLPDDTVVTFGQGDLRFSRLKHRGPLEGPAMINFEFVTLYRVTDQLDDDAS